MKETLKEFWLRLKALGRRRQLDRDLQDELDFHLAMREARSQSQGAQDVHSAARRHFGNAARFKEACRELWTFRTVESFLQDLRYGARILRKNSAFTTVAVVTLALGIGANTAIFSLVYQVLLQRLVVQHPEELVILRSLGPHNGRTSSESADGADAFSYPMYKELRDRNTVLAGLIARFPVSLSVAGQGFSERADGELVSGNYFETLGVRPVLGRLFGPQDETSGGADTVAVLSYGYWTRHFGGSPDILNKQLTVNGAVLTVVGVARQGFTGVEIGQTPDIFIPVTMKVQMTPGWDGLDSPRDYWLAILGRLKPHSKRDQAEAALQGVYHTVIQAELPLLKVSKKDEALFLQTKLFLDPGSHGRQILQAYVQQPLLFLAAMVGLVLLIACANLASLLIAKGEARQQEMAVRLSLGAGAGRLLRQLLTESLLLALAGGLAGLAVGVITLRAIVHGMEKAVDAMGLETGLDSHVLLFAAGLSLLTGVFFGLAPALRVLRVAPRSPLQDSGKNSAGSVANVRLRKWMLVFQVAMTVILLSGAGLFTASLIRLQFANLGLRTDRVIQFSIAPGMSRYSPEQTAALADRLKASLAALPGVESADAAEIAVFNNSNTNATVTVAGYTPQENENMDVGQNWVGPDYFTTMGIPLLRGREFTQADAAASPKVAIINQSMAKRFFGVNNAIGRLFAFGVGNGTHPDIQIIGVVADSKHSNVRDQARPFAYLPYAQHKTLSEITFYVRTAQEPAAISSILTKTVSGFDAGLPVYDLKPLAEQVQETVFADRLLAFLSASLGILAAFLAAIGLYGVMAYVVARRTREIGIRIALGATRTNISWLILREVAQVAGIGLAIGLPLSFLTGKLIESLLFGVSPGNPVVLLLTAAVLVTVALMAGGLPARKAAAVDPMVALRYQ
jgi:predicted permease